MIELTKPFNKKICFSMSELREEGFIWKILNMTHIFGKIDNIASDKFFEVSGIQVTTLAYRSCSMAKTATTATVLTFWGTHTEDAALIKTEN